MAISTKFAPVAAATLLATISLAQEPKDFSEISLDSLLNIPVSTAAKHQQSAQQAPASVSVITAEDIAHYDYRSIAEALNSVHGFYVSYDRNYLYLGARGFSRPTDYNNRILLMLNGHALNEDVYESALLENAFPIAMEAIERIEIVRGPGSSLYGTNAVFATVNVITRSGQELEEADVAVRAGSNNLYEGTGMTGFSFGPTSDGMVAVRAGHSEGPDLQYSEFADAGNGGMVRGRDWERYGSVFATSTFDEFSISGFFSSRTKSVPTASFSTVFDADETTLDQRAFLEGKYSTLPGERTRFAVRAYIDHYRYEGHYMYPDGDEPDESIGVWAGGEAQLTWDMLATNRLIVGTEFQRHFRSDYRLWTPTETLFSGDFPFRNGSVYLQDEWQPLTEISLLGSVRADFSSRAARTIAPRFAIVYTPAGETAFKFLYGEAFRMPNTYELIYEDPLLGYLPSGPLVPEYIRSIELVAETRLTKNLHLSASVFDYRISDLIDMTMNPIDSTYTFENASAATSRGVEFQINADIPSFGNGFVGYTYADAKTDGSDASLTNSPRHVFRAGIVGHILGNVHAGCELFAESERTTVQGSSTPPFGIVNLVLRYITPLQGLSARLRCDNVLDAAYAYPGGYEHLQNAILQNGRTFLLTLSYSIGIR